MREKRTLNEGDGTHNEGEKSIMGRKRPIMREKIRNNEGEIFLNEENETHTVKRKKSPSKVEFE